MTRFSIVIPAYNAEATLAETLGAVIGQEFEDWECVVVDDGSADRTLAIAADFAERDARFKALSQPNQGTAGAYDTGVRAAEGELVVTCSSDDVLLPEHLHEMERFIRDRADYDIFSANGYWWREDGSRELVYEPGDIPDSMEFSDLTKECFYSVGAAYRRELFDAVGGYRIGVFGEDYDFWLRAVAGGARHAYLDKPLSLHRLSSTQKSARMVEWCRSDIRLLSDIRQHPKLTVSEREAVDEGIRLRERRLSRVRFDPLRRVVYRAWVGVATPFVGAERAQSAPSRVKAAVRERFARSSRQSDDT